MSAASPTTTTQNICRCRRCSRGCAQTSPGAHRAGKIYSCRNARPMKTSITPTKNGRYGSSAVNWLIQAPLIPRVSNTNGATQQSEPTIAANTLAHNCLVAVCTGSSLHQILPAPWTRQSASEARARGGEIGAYPEQAGRPSPITRCAARLGGSVRSTSWCELSDHRATGS